MADNLNWQRFMVQILPESPLILGDESGFGNFAASAEYIPGSVLRGAIAAKLLAACKRPADQHRNGRCPESDDCPFWQLFSPPQPLFGFGYFGRFGPVWPLPLTARSCKRYPGYRLRKTDKNAASQHGIVDILLADLAYGQVSDPCFPYREMLQPALVEKYKKQQALSLAWHPGARTDLDICNFNTGPESQACEEPLAPVSGYYRWHTRPQGVDPVPVQRRTHVGINRSRAVAEDRLLFTQEALDVGHDKRAFFASVVVPADKVDVLETALKGQHFLGRGRSRGYGEVILRSRPDPSYPPLADRLTNFNQLAEKALQRYHKIDPDVTTTVPGRLFSLTLRSPAVLGKAGQPLRFPVSSLLGLPDGVVPLRAWARTELVGGWHSAARLPRRTQMAVRAGSVLLYFAPKEIGEKALIAALGRIQMEGIGIDREQGYGEVDVCAAFHLENARL